MNLIQNAVRSLVNKSARSNDAHQSIGKTARLNNNMRLMSLLTSLCVLLSISIAPMAQAQGQIMKCKDIDGTIVYSDVACDNGELMGEKSNDESDSTPPVMTHSKNTMPASKSVAPLRETDWARRPLTANKKSLDQLTIRDARSTLTASDQAIESLRQQTLASNR